MQEPAMNTLLQVEHLSKRYRTIPQSGLEKTRERFRRNANLPPLPPPKFPGILHAVDDVSFTINSGESVGLVGESGCGKSVTSLSLMGLIEKPGQVTGGEALLT